MNADEGSRSDSASPLASDRAPQRGMDGRRNAEICSLSCTYAEYNLQLTQVFGKENLSSWIWLFNFV